MKPRRVETMPDAIYWTGASLKDACGILAGAYLIVNGHPILGGLVLVLAIL